MKKTIATLCTGALALLSVGCERAADPGAAAGPGKSTGHYVAPSTIDPINLAALRARSGVAAGPSHSVGIAGPSRSLTPDGEAIISNGTIQLGVARLGNLNVAGGTLSGEGTVTDVGLRFVPTNNEATADGCLCEGWGVADMSGPQFTGYANKSSGTDGLTEVSFTSSDGFSKTAKSVVTAGGEGGKQVRVTHDFHPSAATPNLYEVTVTIENIGSAPVGDLRYRRTFDWDVEPTAFEEYVTIQGTTGASTLTVRRATNNGFSTSDPLIDDDDRGASGDFVDFGPRDQGSNFDFTFGALAVGAKKSFTIYYGAAANATGAISALKAVGAEVYSLGKPSVDPDQPATAGNPESGTPNTFAFGFKGVGGKAINNPPNVTFTGPGGSVTAGSSVTLDFTVSDPENDTPLACTIDYGTGGGASAVTPCGGSGSAAHTYGTPGEYTATFTAKDPFGATTTKTVKITVTGGTGGENRAPVPTLSVTPATGTAPLAVKATTGATDPDGDAPLACRINWGGGSGDQTLDSCTNAGAGALAHTYAAAGTYTVTLTARDPKGLEGTATAKVVVSAADVNHPPVIVNLRGFPDSLSSYPLNGASCYAREQVCIKYTIRDEDAGDTPFKTTVNWGDGSPTYVPNDIPGQNIPLLAFHKYAAAGTYTVTVTATDRRGASSTETVSIKIDP